MDAGDASTVEKAMIEVSEGVKEVFKVIFEQFVHGTHDMKRLFILYIQEPSGWGLDGLHGLSASQLLSLRAMDAFCSFENESQMAGMIMELDHYTTRPMRNFTNALREAKVGVRLLEDRENDTYMWTAKTYETFEEMVRRVRMFRQSHRRFVDSYITKGQKMDRPTVTSLNGLLYSEYNKSQKLAVVIAKEEKQDSTVTMDEMLAGRVKETVVPWQRHQAHSAEKGVRLAKIVEKLPSAPAKAASDEGSMTSMTSSSSSLSDMSESSAESTATTPSPLSRVEQKAVISRNDANLNRRLMPFRFGGTLLAALLGAILLAGLRSQTIAYVCFEEPSLMLPSATMLFCILAASLVVSLPTESAKSNVSIDEKRDMVDVDMPGAQELKEAVTSTEEHLEEEDFKVFLAFLNAPSDSSVDPKEQLARAQSSVFQGRALPRSR